MELAKTYLELYGNHNIDLITISDLLHANCRVVIRNSIVDSFHIYDRAAFLEYYSHNFRDCHIEITSASLESLDNERNSNESEYIISPIYRLLIKLKLTIKGEVHEAIDHLFLGLTWDNKIDYISHSIDSFLAK